MSAGWKRVMESDPMAIASDQSTFWDNYLAEHPDVLHRLLADVYQATYGAERPPTLDDIWELVAAPKFSTVPFSEAIYQALDGRSQRWLAREAGLHWVTYLRWRDDPIVPHDVRGSMQRMEIIAAALGVHPSYFSEWRRLWLMSFLDRAMTGEISIGIYRRFAGLQERAPRVNGR